MIGITSVISLLFGWSIPTTSADVLFSIQHLTPVDSLQTIARFLDDAQKREPEMQEYPMIVAPASTGQMLKMVLACGPHQPTAEGAGCDLYVKPLGSALTGQLSISIRKKLERPHLLASIGRIQKRLLESDPNTTADHLNFGNPLNTIASDRISYHCEAAGTAPHKAWNCFLFVAEGAL